MQLAGNEFAKERMFGKFPAQEVRIGQFAHRAYAVRYDHILELLVGFRVLDNAEERREPRSCREQVKRPAGPKVADSYNFV